MHSTQNRRWVRSSVHEWLQTACPSLTFRFGEHLTDIDAALAAAAVVVLVDWLKRSTVATMRDARQIAWPLSLTVVSNRSADPYGSDLDGVVSQLCDALANARIQLKDYTDPGSPVATNHSAFVQSVDDDEIGESDKVRAIAVTAELQYFERL